MKPIKKKTKKLTKKISLLDKWRNTAALLKQSLGESQSQIQYWKGRYDTLNEKFDDVESKYNKIISNYECVPRPIMLENQWLKEIIELLTVPADKLGKLEEIRRERMNREDPLNDYNRRMRGF